VVEKKFKGLRLPVWLREKLRTLLEPLATNADIVERVKGKEKIVSVGDLCTLTLVRKKIQPHIAIVDFKTKRLPVEHLKKELKKICKKSVRVNNPAGTITPELWDAIENAYKNTESTRIEITGEEDLSALVCIALAPENSVIVYGMPDKGIAVVHANKKSKDFANEVLHNMEPLEGS
jgi:hypothetical protein